MVMSNLATTLSVVGRYNDALSLREKVLESFRRCYPVDHPHIGAYDELLL
jgi:hypothetical protein